MFPLALAIDYSAGFPLIVGAGISMYLASKALADALVAGRAGVPGRLAIGHWLPIAVLAMAATLSHRGPVAMGLIFSTAIACLSLATGAVGFLGASVIPPSARRSWAMLVPASLLAFLAGFRASVSLFNAGVLALQGLCVLLLWNDGIERPSEEVASVPATARSSVFRIAELVLGISLAVIGSWFAIHGIDRVAAESEFATTGLLTTTLLSPLLVLPIIGTGTELAQRNESATAITSQVGVALLNICGLFPMVVAADAMQKMFVQRSFATESLIGFPFPLAVWRVDVVMLIALGLFLLPVAIGKWSISKMQGVGLMLGYAIYLGLAIIIGVLRV